MKLLILGTVLFLLAINLISADSAESDEDSTELSVSSEEISDEISNRPSRGPKEKRPRLRPQRNEEGGRRPFGPRKGREGDEKLPKPEGENGEELRESRKAGLRRPRAVDSKAKAFIKAKAVIPKAIRRTFDSKEVSKPAKKQSEKI
ncbi:unnamed protein product [Cylicocyclus nassatus]|uniref:Uncharacterized protein n=1 Tax=Cylicocyclus nassatus TaxID=53992 RepID=A0AA36H853_CYLNA|nr:unnamed protein product [Cylicocyclus nassatus]